MRLKGYDYSLAGAYFVTIVVQGRLRLFGKVVGEEMRESDAGKMIRRVWDGMPKRFPCIEMDEFVVMPNHIHGIIMIRQSSACHPVGAPLVGALALGNVVGAYKSLTTVEYGRGVRETDWPRFDKRLWQRNYYERVIRDESELGRAREYIISNPMQWKFDGENPARTEAKEGRAPTSDAPTDGRSP